MTPLFGALQQFFGSDVDRVTGSGEGDGIAGVAGGKNQRAAVESLGDAFGAEFETAFSAKQVDGQQPLRAQPRTAGLIERQGIEDPGARVFVESVDQDGVEMAVTVAHEVGAVVENDPLRLRVVLDDGA